MCRTHLCHTCYISNIITSTSYVHAAHLSVMCTSPGIPHLSGRSKPWANSSSVWCNTFFVCCIHLLCHTYQQYNYINIICTCSTPECHARLFCVSHSLNNLCHTCCISNIITSTSYVHTAHLLNVMCTRPRGWFHCCEVQDQQWLWSAVEVQC